MADPQRALHVLNSVRRRLTWIQWAMRTLWFTLALGTVYAGLLLFSRLTGLIPDVFSPESVLIVPALAAFVALVWPGRPTLEDAARAIDASVGGKDLFLTLTMLQRASTMGYEPLVVRDAEKAAARVKADEATRFTWRRPGAIATATMVLLFLGTLFLPALDPFGKVADAKEEDQQRKLLEATKEQTALRRAQLKQKDVEAETSEEVEQAVESLKKGLAQTKRGDRKANLERLSEHQEELGKMYRRLNAGDLKKLLNDSRVEQKLGALHDQEMFRKWQKELQQGASEGLQERLDEVEEALERLTKTTDPVERSELQRKIQKQLKELADFSSSKAGSQAMTAALERAMEQLKAGKNEALSQEAMQALKESLELSREEMQLLAQSVRDMKNLEEALELISMSKQMNAQDQLDGEMFGGEMTLADYAEMYNEMMGMGGDGEGDGEGTGGRGMGEGGTVEEDDAAKTDFVDEKTKAAVQKGKILLSIKTKGLSDTGDIADAEYRRVAGELREELDAVLEQEQIPPGYVDGIKQYFDAIADDK